jgi:transcriptional regulator with XRE-family HTH domain
MSEWPKIIAQLIAERKISQRKLCRLSGVCRNSLAGFMNGGGIMSDSLERLLGVLGYELAAVSNEDDSECQSKARRSARAVELLSRPPGKGAHAKSSATASARPAMTSTVPRLVNAVTTQSGNSPAKPI